MTLSIQLPEDAERRLREAASRLRVPVADLAAAAVRDFVTVPSEEFEQAAKRVLDTNRELYRRLA
jgi:predicted transcriptional regulator